MLGRWINRRELCSSPARLILQARCRLASTHVPGRILKGDDLGPVREDGHQTFRARKDEAAKELPLSPLLDPVVLKKRARFEQTKKQPKVAEFTPFQRKLWETPFAHALASPHRQCRSTMISLPVALLTSLHARPHPTTHDPWLLPISLTTDEKHLGPPYRFLGRQIVAAQLGKKKAWEKGLYARMTEKFGGHNIKNMVWREDMPAFLLSMMQKRVAEKLSWYLGLRGRLKPVASPLSEDIDRVDNVSCVLIFRTLRTRADDLQDQANNISIELEKWSSYFGKSFVAKLDPHASPAVTHTSPHWYTEPLVPRLQPRLQFPELEFRTTTWRGRKVAVYSLTDLLGEERIQKMIPGSRYPDAKSVVLTRARSNVPFEVLLMQLQAYIAKPGP